MPPAEVGVVTLKTEQVTLQTELAGRTAASLTSDVRPQVSGIVKSRAFDDVTLAEWEARLEAVPPAATTPPETPPAPDVLAQVPPTAETLLLEQIWRLEVGSSPLKLLLLWEPTDETDKYLRRFLLDFGHRVLLAADRERSGDRP